ncbi:PilN domain-containing protein [Candidatus Leptofilum sp.]|uniref:PilN domain-containing protein n=1 Tax=Candidatus Leptofilum sp. TaxID=3241576 RepID=UPI003B5B7F01
MQTDSPFDLEEVAALEEPEPARPFGSITLWLGVLGLVILFIPLYLMSNSLGNEVTRLEGKVVPLQTALASTLGPQSEAEGLIVTLTAVHDQTAQMNSILTTLKAENVDWNAVMSAINDVSESELALTGVEQAGDQLIIRGRAAGDAFVNAYASQLEASGQFSQVIIQSVSQIAEPFLSPTPTLPPPTATATPVVTNTPSPTAVPTRVPVTPMSTWTPTPKLTDDFEWDDTHAKPIFVGAPAQLHNFYPNFDVDHVVFLAKMGRTYEVSTDFLAPGVDTFLTVSYGDVVLENDDATLGTLSSSVTLQAPTDSDVEVLVRVTNRGVYGPDKWYDLLVLEIVPTTPTPSATPTSTTPTPTPSPTVDFRDVYEPNDVDPNPIAIGESQIHNFFPNGDLDNVGFLVKNGRFYQVLTSQLGVGVDTAVTVSFNGETWSNDDYDLPGSGNFASAVCFPAEVDGTAVAAISNVAQQYDPSKTYIVSVQEVPFLTIDPEEIDFGMVTQGSASPLTQTVQIEGSEPLDWEVITETPWLTTDVITGTTPATLNVIADISGLAVGVHEGEITLGWADFCRQTVPVTIQIDAVQSELPTENGRFLPSAKVAHRQSQAVEFVIAVTLGEAQSVEP